MKTTPLALLALVVMAPLVSAQEVKPARLLPANYKDEVYFDMKRAIDIELWDGMRGSVMGALFGMFEQEYGFALDDLHSIRGVPPAPNENGQRTGDMLLLFLGNENVGLPSSLENSTEVRFGEFDVTRVQQPWSDQGTIYYCPKDGVLLHGREDRLRPAFMDGKLGGTPHPMVTAASAHKNSVGHVVMSIVEKDLEHNPLFEHILLSKEWWTKEDPLEVFAMQVLYDEDEDAVTVQLKMRFKNGKIARAKAAGAIRSQVEVATKHRNLAAFKRYWKALEIVEDRSDLLVKLPLGRPRNAGAQLAAMLAPMMVMGTSSAEPVAAPVAVPVAPAVPVKPAKGGKKK